MDDLLTGASSLAEAVTKQKTIHSALAGAHFPLRKYISNSSQFLAKLDPSLVEPLQPIEFAPTGAAKVLGLQWEPATDYFSIKTAPVNLSGVTLTKRIVASVAAQAFDPTGFAAPVIIRAKFINYQKDISLLGAVSMPRFYHMYGNSSITLAGFCDASLKAYGAAVYL